MMLAFIDAHRDEYGVEPICRQLQIAPFGITSRRPDRRIRPAYRHGLFEMPN